MASMEQAATASTTEGYLHSLSLTGFFVTSEDAGHLLGGDPF